MILQFTKLETTSNTIQVSWDGGNTWNSFPVDSVKENGIHFTKDDCSDFSLIKIKGKFKSISDLDFVTTTNSEVSAKEDKKPSAFYSVITKDNVATGYGLNIEIPEGITSIGNGAFKDCSSLTSIIIPNSVTSIGSNAFYGCTDLTSIEIPNSVTSIGNDAFYGCTGLTSIVIPSSVTSIGTWAFYGCKNLASIVLLDGVNSIGTGAFRECSGLTSIEIPDSVTSINDTAFYNCSNLPSIKIPDSVTYIGKDVFYGCGKLTPIEIPDSVTYIGTNISYGLKNSQYIDDYYIPTKSGKTFLYRSVPLSTTEFIIRDDCIGINASVFCDCDSLTSIEIPDSVTSIGNKTFQSCTGLTSIEIPSSVTSIENNTFYNCNSLTSIIIPNSVTSISNEAFYNCNSLTSIVIPNSVTSISNNAFGYCSSLTSIEIPNSVTYIGNRAFQHCDSLTSITVSKDNPKYDSRNNCNAVIETATNTLIHGCKNTVIPDSVTSIGDNAFCYCNNLTSIEIPNSVTYISESAFSYCNNLKIYLKVNELPEIITLVNDVLDYGYYNYTIEEDDIYSIIVNDIRGEDSYIYIYKNNQLLDSQDDSLKAFTYDLKQGDVITLKICAYNSATDSLSQKLTSTGVGQYSVKISKGITGIGGCSNVEYVLNQ